MPTNSEQQTTQPVLESTVDDVATQGHAWYELPAAALGAGFVISGPIGKSQFPGRRFASLDAAVAWAKDKYARVTIEPASNHLRWILRVVPRGKGAA